MRVDRWSDRRDAGRALAVLLRALAERGCVVAAVGTEAVPVAFEVARAIGAPLGVVAVAPVRAPSGDVVAAITDDGQAAIDVARIASFGLLPRSVLPGIRTARRAARRDARRLRVCSPDVDVRGRTVVVVADAVESAAPARAAIRAVRALGAHDIVLATPVGDANALADLGHDADQVLSTRTLAALERARDFYERFEPPPASEVEALLRAAAAVTPAAPRAPRPA